MNDHEWTNEARLFPAERALLVVVNDCNDPAVKQVKRDFLAAQPEAGQSSPFTRNRLAAPSRSGRLRFIEVSVPRFVLGLAPGPDDSIGR